MEFSLLVHSFPFFLSFFLSFLPFFSFLFLLVPNPFQIADVFLLSPHFVQGGGISLFFSEIDERYNSYNYTETHFRSLIFQEGRASILFLYPIPFPCVVCSAPPVSDHFACGFRSVGVSFIFPVLCLPHIFIDVCPLFLLNILIS